MLAMLEQLKAVRNLVTLLVAVPSLVWVPVAVQAQEAQAAAGVSRVEEVPEEVEEEIEEPEEGHSPGDGQDEPGDGDDGFGLTQEEWDAMSPEEQQRVQELMMALAQRQAELATVREEQAKLHAQAQELRAAVTAPVTADDVPSPCYHPMKMIPLRCKRT
jgi:DNA repair exonuclease SbcCD ATPase subunit